MLDLLACYTITGMPVIAILEVTAVMLDLLACHSITCMPVISILEVF